MFNTASFPAGAPVAVERIATAVLTADAPALPTYLAGDLLLPLRGRTSAVTAVVSSPWADTYTPFSDGDGQPCSFQVAHTVATSSSGLTNPLDTAVTGIYSFWHFRNALLGAQIAAQSAASGAIVTVPALAGIAVGSWVIGGFYSRAAQTLADMQLMIPAGYTQRRVANGTTNSLILFDSNGPVVGGAFAGVGATTMTTTTGGWASFAIEIKRATG